MSSNCGCGEGQAPTSATQRQIEAWVQPGGAGVLNDVYYAMSGGEYPGIRITNKSRKRRGTRTPIYRRTGVGRFHKCGVRETSPAANTITVEFAACGCGGFDASELIQCDLTVYEMEVCCPGSGGSFTTGWSKIKVTTGISFESDDYSAGVSFNQEDDNDLVISHPGEFDVAFTLYPIAISEIGAAGGFDTGASVEDVIYASTRCQPGQPCSDSCSESWYAVTNEGTLIYKTSRTAEIASATITGWPLALPTRVSMAEYQGKLFVLAQGTGVAPALYMTKLSSYGAPSTWTNTSIGLATTSLDGGLLVNGSKLYAFGSEAGAAKIYQIDGGSGAGTSYFTGAAASGTLFDAVNCGRTILAVGAGGNIFYSGGCSNTLNLLTTSPTAVDILSIGSQKPGVWWIGTTDGRVYFSEDEGETWAEKSFSFSGTGDVYEIVWANPVVGHIAQSNGTVLNFYTTFDGGKTWTNTEDRIDTNVTAGIGRRVAVPCCPTQTINVNNFLMVGENAGVGQIWQGSIKTC